MAFLKWLLGFLISLTTTLLVFIAVFIIAATISFNAFSTVIINHSKDIDVGAKELIEEMPLLDMPSETSP